MTLPIRLERRAVDEIESARRWWLDNRPAAPTAFDEELERAFGMLRTLPRAGQPVHASARVGLRRLFLGRIRYHLYYVEVADALVVFHTGTHHEDGPGL